MHGQQNIKKTFKKIQILLKSDKNNWHFSEDPSTVMKISRLFLLRMRNISDRGTIRIQVLRSITLFPETFAIYEMQWKNMVETTWPKITI